MKLKLVIAQCIAWSMAMHCSYAQLTEKIYDISDGGQVFTTVENIPLGLGQGQILMSGRTVNSIPLEDVVITRVDNEGVIDWQTIYAPSGNYDFDVRVMIKSHRVGFHPDNNTVLAVGTNYYTPHYAPSFVELDLSTGNIEDEYYYGTIGSPDITTGLFNAIHSVMSGTHRGAYMVGYGVNHNDGVIPLITKVGGVSEFQKIYDDVDNEDPAYGYFDVDVDNTDGYVIAVGVKNESHNFIDEGGYGIVDVFQTNGTHVASYEYDLSNSGEEWELGRFSAVKCVAPGRVVIGGRRNGQGFVMQINYLNGDIHWSRQISGTDGLQVGDIIEVEQDDEGQPIIMGVETHHLVEQQPAGPGFVARLLTNGEIEWAIQEDMDHGYGDLEPQYTDEGLLAMLTGTENEGQSRLTYLQPTTGFYGCENFVVLEAVSDPEVTHSSVNRTFTGISGYNSIEPSAREIEISVTEGCCWLPSFNPMPWNHPWESTYYNDDPAVIDLTGYYPTYTYNWDMHYVRDLRNLQTTASPSNFAQSGASNQIGTFDFEWGTHAEYFRYHIIATDPNGCKGRDDGALTMVDDNAPVERPDYSSSTYGADLEHPYYIYCSQTTTTPRYLYEHVGWNLGSNGFDHVSPPASLTYPNILNGGTNYLSSTGLKQFTEEVTDDFNTGTTRIATVNTDVDVIGCATGCGSSLSPIDWTAENGLRMFSIASSDLNNDPPIVRFAFSLHLDNSSTELHEMVKRYNLRKRPSTSAIVEDDYLIPVLDQRYMDSYPAYNLSSFNKLYLDVWYKGSASTYPYTITCHKRFEINLDPSDVSRLAPTDEEGGQVDNFAREANGYWIYPNPAKGMFHLHGIEGDAVMKVYNAEGKLIWKSIVNGEAGEEQLIDLQQQPVGLYFLNIQQAHGGVIVHKLMRE